MTTKSNPWKPPRAIVVSWLGLITLLCLTLALAYAPLGAFNTIAALTIAFIKALIIAAVFMELAGHRPLIIAFAAAGFYWLAILFWLSFADFLTRGELPPRISLL